MSELEGQQLASGRAMFLLSGPQREAAKQGTPEDERERWVWGGEEKWNSLFLTLLACQGNHKGRALWPSCPSLSCSHSGGPFIKLLAAAAMSSHAPGRKAREEVEMKGGVAHIP